MNSKHYLKILFGSFSILLTLAVAYVYYFSSYYPLPITDRISFDAKIKFVRDHINPNKVDTLIVGSSIGLNNIQGVYLEKGSKKCNGVLNFSVYEASAFQVNQLLELRHAFPNLKRVIYSAQFSDFQPAGRYNKLDPTFLMHYLRKELSYVVYLKLLFNSCKNIFFCINRQMGWKEKHGENSKFTFLGFDHTGSVPLHIYGNDIIQRRWQHPHGPLQVPATFKAVKRIANKLQKDGIKFYFVQQPYRQPLTIDKYKYIGDVIGQFAQRIQKIIHPYNGAFLSLHEKLNLDDKYFADRSHLNDQGSILSAEAIGKFIDEREK